MYSETYPLNSTFGSYLKNARKFSSETFLNRELTHLYIGENVQSGQFFDPYFKSGLFAKNLLHAQLVLQKFSQTIVPDAIFIDLPFNKIEFLAFYSFLSKEGLFLNTVIVYNENKLDKEKVKQVKQHSFVDDVINFNSDDINYTGKVAFLKRVKTRQVNLLVTRNGQLSIEPLVEKKPLGFMKRLFDIVISFIGIVICSPLLLLIAIAVKLESKGSVMYTSKRAGRGFKIFNFYKFRTMEMGADQKINSLMHLNQYGTENKGAKFLKISNDPRVTKIGKLLRNTSLDELPQLFNVLKGDMSLVGNRPLPLYEAATLTTDESVERFMAPAGITGLWQVKKRGREEMSSEERISLDILYARKYSLFFDLWIIAQTPRALFQKRNV